MLKSMTGFASAAGSTGPFDWSLDVKSVNNKGLDLRLRVPDWLDGLELTLRKMIAEKISRGSVQLSLKVTKSGSASERVLDPRRVEQIVRTAAEVRAIATPQNVEIAALSLGDILTLGGFQDAQSDEAEIKALNQVLRDVFPKILADLVAHRESEGAALAEILTASTNRIEAAIAGCAGVLVQRQDEFEASFRAALKRLGQDQIEPDRLSSEMAILAVKSDVTEELDRLKAHVAAARELLASEKAVGRKFDFLMQEFNREANTLCSKSGSPALTEIGLDLKVTIDQMREQIQNVE